jgi:hypothetical protein
LQERLERAPGESLHQTLALQWQGTLGIVAGFSRMTAKIGEYMYSSIDIVAYMPDARTWYRFGNEGYRYAGVLEGASGKSASNIFKSNESGLSHMIQSNKTTVRTSSKTVKTIC